MAEFTEELKQEMLDRQPLDWNIAQELAERYDVKPRSIVASAVRQGLEYSKKVRVSKTGDKIASKSDLVGDIAVKYGIDASKLDGLEKANKSALQALLA